MTVPDVLSPSTLTEALDLLRRHAGRARLIAGGTDLIPRLRLGENRPAVLINLSRVSIPGLRREGDWIIVGAGMTHSALARAPEIRKHFPALACSCQSIGGRPVRNRGTIGGNLANASPAADTAPALLIYDAELRLLRSEGERCIPISELFTGPGATVLREDEMIVEVCLPLPRPRSGASFIKLGRRQSMAIAVVSVAARLTLDAADCAAEVRLAMGSAAPVPFRAATAEGLLLGAPLEEERIRAAAAAAREAASPISDLRATASYRSRMVEVLARRALYLAWEAARV